MPTSESPVENPPELRPGGALLLVLICFAGVMTVSVIGADLTQGGTTLVFAAASMVGPLVAMYVGLNRYTPMLRTAAALGLGRPGPRQLALIPVAIVVGACLVPLLEQVTKWIVSVFPWGGAPGEEAPGPPELAGQIALLAIIVLAGPFIQECFFRGFLLGRLRLTVGPWRALAIVTVLFVLLHVQPRVMPEALILAVVLGALALVAKNTWIPILAHVSAAMTDLVLPSTLVSPEIVAACAAAVALGLLAAWRIAPRDGEKVAAELRSKDRQEGA